MGRRGVRGGAAARRSHPAQRGLFFLPLVPRDGARVFREPAHRRDDERGVCQHKGRPRGAPGRRFGLYDRDSGDERTRRLAYDGVYDGGRRAVLRRDVFPARRQRRDAGVRPRPGGYLRRLRQQAARGAVGGQAARRACPPVVRRRARGGAAHGRRLSRRYERSRQSVRRRVRRVRPAAQVPAAGDAGFSA